MNRTLVTPLLLLMTSVVVGVVLTAQTPDRITLKSPDGISIADFPGYEAWPVVSFPGL